MPHVINQSPSDDRYALRWTMDDGRWMSGWLMSEESTKQIVGPRPERYSLAANQRLRTTLYVPRPRPNLIYS